MLGDERVSGGAMVAQRLRRALLVYSHQTAVARHIGGTDRGKTGCNGLLHGLPQQRRS